MQFTQYHPQFFTATNLQWKHLLKEDKYKDVTINSLRFLVSRNRVKVYSFVIMPKSYPSDLANINGARTASCTA
ncbi:MAG: hypothetical protein ABIQ88_02980 [Chitinophagaceae bacterium]